MLLRQAFKGALATLDRGSGGPYASLVTVATAADGTPLVLLSSLALHTQNLGADARACLLIDGSGPTGDPLAGGRVSLSGRIVATPAAHDRARFLARLPEAAVYADFADFVFHRLVLERAHFIGGFGRIIDIAPQHLLTDVEGADGLLAAEADIVAHMNADHGAALASIGTAALREIGVAEGDAAAAGPWRMSGIDPDGCDLATAVRGLRIAFPERVTTPGAARSALARLAAAARTSSG